MARSTYIYVLYLDGELLTPFTVKHEMLTYVKRNPGNYYYQRHRDGRPDEPITEVIL